MQSSRNNHDDETSRISRQTRVSQQQTTFNQHYALMQPGFLTQPILRSGRQANNANGSRARR